ncbi:MAG TPA: 2Fe-2S iron-sulfur cluster-binding protein, partial [Gaiellaceae bacterium]|nr:2Fe-2S iron-sulfur cluster-binding protein [Gaiellaceae bacterium]
MASERARTIASAAVGLSRPAISSSFRFHRPRGPVCGRGYCSQCEVETGHGRALACETPADGRRRRRVDPLRPLGRVAERWPPWFYERRFLRTELVRRTSLDVLRRASAAGRLGPEAPSAEPRGFEERDAETVVVVEGRGAAAESGALVVSAAEVLGVYPDRTLGVLRDDRLLEVRFDRLVLDTGSYDRLPPVEGNDLPGVIGLTALERYADDLAPGTRIAFWGAEAAVSSAEIVAAARGLEVVWAGAEAPRSL